MSREIWLLRHAETEWSRDGRHTGRSDIPLTDLGRAAAAALAPVVSKREWAAVFSSPLSRALQTASLAGLGAAVVQEPDLWEWDYGDYEGLTTVQIQAERPDWSLFRDGCPGGEAARDVGARVDRVIARALAVPGDGDIALVAHGHVLRVLGARWAEEPAGFGERLALSTASICVLGFEHDTQVFWRWNETAAEA